MDKTIKISQNLLGHVSRWQTETIEALRLNNSAFFDMAWLFQGVYFKDSRHVYASRSDYFTCLFRNDMRKGTDVFEGVTAFRVSDPMSKKHIFDMMRIFCHTGIVQVDKGESILKTMERYSAFHYYGIRGGMEVIRQLAMDVINPTNAVQALEYAMSSPECLESPNDTGLLSDIKNYIAIYAFVVFKHKSFYSLASENLGGLAQICTRDDLNIREIDLLHCIYRLCERKIGTDRDLQELGSAWEVMTHDFDESGSLWSQVRLSSITMREFVKFIKENKNCFSSDNVVKIITFLYSCAETDGESSRHDEDMGVHANADANADANKKKRKPFRPISFYPRNLEFHGLASPQTDISFWDDSKIKLFFAFDSAKKEAAALPPVHFHNFFVHCSVFHADKSINVAGNIHGKSVGGACEQVTITSSVVNFRHDRWRKKAVVSPLTGGTAFRITNILSWNTIGNNDTPGYLFDIEQYPEYSPNGSWILLCICIER
ncbi:unnamed protein product [Pylaiella littoralis]